MLTMDGYRQLSSLVCSLAETVCEGRLLMLQAGGYSASYVPYCTVAAVEPLVGYETGLIDPDCVSSEVACCQAIFTPDTQHALYQAQNWYQQWWHF